ncbi:MAG: oligosaccharide flippase family protein [Ignavibacteriaceae bacterium]
MQKIISNMLKFFNLENSSRSLKAKKNIFFLFIFNGFNFLFNLLLVRLTLDYLGKTEYGVWLTLSSILTWFNYLDFGLGNGLRNKLAEAFAKDDLRSAKIYVSTTYAVFSSIILLIIIVFIAIFRFINWLEIFKAPVYLENELNTLVLLSVIFFLTQFVLRLLTFIINADQKTALNGFFSFSINLLTVLLVYILLKITSPSILILGAGSTFIPVVVFIFASFIFFSRKYKSISPSFKAVRLSNLKDLLGLGTQFFIIQISSLIIFTTDNLIITQLFGPDDVTIYNIAFKYFNYIPIIFFMILTPMWSAYTEAYVKDDFGWIKNAVNKILKVWMLLSILVIIMIFAANRIYDIWLNAQIKVPLDLTILMGLFAIISNWNNIFAYFINGVGKIRLQLYASVIVGIINIPLSIYFAKNLNMGISGVMAATCVCIGVGAVWAPIQYSKIVNKKATGIWAK